MTDDLATNNLGKKGRPLEMEHTSLPRRLQFSENGNSFIPASEYNMVVDAVAHEEQKQEPHQNRISLVGLHLDYVPPAHRDDEGEEKFQELPKRKKRDRHKKIGAQAWKIKPPLKVMQDPVPCPTEMAKGTTPNPIVISTQEHNETVALNTGAIIGINLSNRYAALNSVTRNLEASEDVPQPP
ncbi:hypothetical protein HAX54_040615 [Datura stramonium]|uniref:Uncharacterized protein n=1 Tax=Datura stramonium TaxID=4076 RepID=A0ABS8SKN2_DATST|nr:hypothetical protein [Datura stramonium]